MQQEQQQHLQAQYIHQHDMQDLLHLLKRRSKIHAIKLVRDHTGLGLKEAKDYIDALAATE